MNDQDFIEVLAKLGDACAYINAATLDELYDAITMPPPFCDALVLHAEQCPACKGRIREARKHDLDTLPASARRQLTEDVARVKAAIEQAFAQEASTVETEPPGMAGSPSATVVRGLPGSRPMSKERKVSPLKAPQTDRRSPSLVRLTIGRPPTEYTQFGAAASHKSAKPTPRHSFTLSWSQEDEVWTMEGKGGEVVLASKCRRQAGFITWKDLITGDMYRVELTHSADGRVLVDILPWKALLHVEAIRKTVNEEEQRSLLPVVHMAGTSL